jgi:hypothetical protein
MIKTGVVQKAVVVTALKNQGSGGTAQQKGEISRTNRRQLSIFYFFIIIIFFFFVE